MNRWDYVKSITISGKAADSLAKEDEK